jgi:hypothetical protein
MMYKLKVEAMLIYPSTSKSCQHLAGLLGEHIGDSLHHVRNSMDFISIRWECRYNLVFSGLNHNQRI